MRSRHPSACRRDRWHGRSWRLLLSQPYKATSPRAKRSLTTYSTAASRYFDLDKTATDPGLNDRGSSAFALAKPPSTLRGPLHCSNIERIVDGADQKGCPGPP